MCVVSMIGDHYRDKWGDNLDTWRTWTMPQVPGPTQAEFDKLKAEVEEMKQLLKRAKLYDEETGRAGCEMDEKMEILRKVAELVGVDLSDVLGTES